jgi:hypothetical protein
LLHVACQDRDADLAEALLRHADVDVNLADAVGWCGTTCPSPARRKIRISDDDDDAQDATARCGMSGPLRAGRCGNRSASRLGLSVPCAGQSVRLVFDVRNGLQAQQHGIRH